MVTNTKLNYAVTHLLFNYMFQKLYVLQNVSVNVNVSDTGMSKSMVLMGHSEPIDLTLGHTI
jgi:hypothetical protein